MTTTSRAVCLNRISMQRMMLGIRNRARDLTRVVGAATCERITAGETSDSWDMIACVDRFVELGELFEIPNTRSQAGQHRIFVSRDP